MSNEKLHNRNILFRLSKIIGILTLAIIIVLLGCWLFSFFSFTTSKPKTEELMKYARETYQKEFVLVREYTCTNRTEGEKPISVKGCPAVELEDTDTGIHFEVEAWPTNGWNIRDDYGQKVLLFCIEEQGLRLDEKNKFQPCLILENSREEAEKLRQMTIRFNENYSVNKDKSYHTSESFTVPQSDFIYQVEAGYISDRWTDDISPFCFDTPIEKYEAFLNEVVSN